MSDYPKLALQTARFRCWESNLGSLKEQQLLLTTEPVNNDKTPMVSATENNWFQKPAFCSEAEATAIMFTGEFCLGKLGRATEQSSWVEHLGRESRQKLF